MQGFRQFILSVIGILEMLFVIAITLLFGILGALIPAAFGGSGAGLIGFILGALAGFCLSAIIVNISMCLAEIAANTHHLKKR
jgi:hypothetical protein